MSGKCTDSQKGNKIPKLSRFMKYEIDIDLLSSMELLGRNFLKKQVCAVWACLRNSQRYGEREVSLML